MNDRVVITLDDKTFNVEYLPAREMAFLKERVNGFLKKLGSSFVWNDVNDPSILMDLMDELEKYRVLFSTIMDAECCRLSAYWIPAVGSPIHVKSGRGINLCSAFAALMLDTSTDCLLDRIDHTGLQDPIH